MRDQEAEEVLTSLLGYVLTYLNVILWAYVIGQAHEVFFK